MKMTTVLDILRKAGGYRPDLYLKIDNAPYMPLVIEAVGHGPMGLPALSVAHYSEQNGDLMRDPEMCFEFFADSFDPYCYRNDCLSMEQWSRKVVDGRYVRSSALHCTHQRFAQTWDSNLAAQRFAEIFDPSKHVLG